MHFSVSVPTCREGLSAPLPFAGIEDVVRLSQAAERLGFDSIWGNDHITAPKYVRDAYSMPPRFFEPLVTLAYVAAQTSRIQLGTAVLVLPMREPVFLAKQVATLDQVSGGRMLLGVGVGAYREEFEHLHPDMRGADRGLMLEESIQALRLLFDQPSASFAGRFYQFDDIRLHPKPLQPHFPILVGGNHRNQERRAALFGDAWLPASIPPDRFREGVARVQQLAVDAGRDPTEVRFAPQVMVSIARTHEAAIKNFSQGPMFRHLGTLGESTLRGVDIDRLAGANLVGTPDEIVERVSEFRDAGATMMATMSFIANSIDGTIEDIQYFAEEVFPAFR